MSLWCNSHPSLRIKDSSSAWYYTCLCSYGESWHKTGLSTYKLHLRKATAHFIFIFFLNCQRWLTSLKRWVQGARQSRHVNEAPQNNLIPPKISDFLMDLNMPVHHICSCPAESSWKYICLCLNTFQLNRFLKSSANILTSYLGYFIISV